MFIDLGDDVKIKRVDVVVQRLVVQEELGKKTKLLTVRAMLFSVDLVHRKIAFSVDLLSRWMPALTGSPVFT
jgi:hypothetical protein